MGYFIINWFYSQIAGIVMTNEEKFLGYLEALKGESNNKLVECVQEGFKTLVEYQVVGNMSERSIDIMEDAVGVSDDKKDLVSYIEKLDKEIEELRDAMQQIDNIADKHDIEDGDEREPMEEAYVMSTDGVSIPTSAEGMEASSQEATAAAEKVEKGGSLEGRDPQHLDDIDPRDIEPIEIGQRKVKVEGYEGYENDDMPENIRRGEAAGNEPEGEPSSESEIDDKEGKMANKQLDQIHDQSGALAGSFADDEELRAWVQAKITKATQTLDTIYEYFREEKKLDEKLGDKDPEDMDDSPEEEEKPIFEK